jgi:hypothetical protein
MLRIRLCRYWWSRPKRTRHANQIRSADSDRRALIKFMTAVATKTCHLILGTATPYQDRGGRIVGSSEQIGDARTRTRTFAVATAGSRQATLTGQTNVEDEAQAWNLCAIHCCREPMTSCSTGCTRTSTSMPRRKTLLTSPTRIWTTSPAMIFGTRSGAERTESDSSSITMRSAATWCCGVARRWKIPV